MEEKSSKPKIDLDIPVSKHPNVFYREGEVSRSELASILAKDIESGCQIYAIVIPGQAVCNSELDHPTLDLLLAISDVQLFCAESCDTSQQEYEVSCADYTEKYMESHGQLRIAGIRKTIPFISSVHVSPEMSLREIIQKKFEVATESEKTKQKCLEEYVAMKSRELEEKFR